MKNKVAVMTACGSGWGRTTALLFAKEGAKLVVNDVVKESCERLVKEIAEKGGEAVFVPGDVSTDAVAKQLINKAIQTYGRVDILYNVLVPLQAV